MYYASYVMLDVLVSHILNRNDEYGLPHNVNIALMNGPYYIAIVLT